MGFAFCRYITSWANDGGSGVEMGCRWDWVVVLKV